MSNGSWTKLNVIFVFLLLDISLIRLFVYGFKDNNACFFKLSNFYNASFISLNSFTSLLLLISTIFYVYSYYRVNIHKDTELIHKKLGRIFTIFFVIGLFFAILSDFTVKLSFLYIIIATVMFIISLYAIIMISFIDNSFSKIQLGKWTSISAVIVIFCVFLDVYSGTACFSLK